jgi:hypothetical protein
MSRLFSFANMHITMMPQTPQASAELAEMSLPGAADRNAQGDFFGGIVTPHGSLGCSRLPVGTGWNERLSRGTVIATRYCHPRLSEALGILCDEVRPANNLAFVPG